MSGAVATRLRRIEAAYGWRLILFVGPGGEERTVPTGVIVDAWLRVALDGGVPDLPPDLSEFIASCRLRPSAGAMLNDLREACRDVWFPDRHKQRDDLDPDPPAFEPDEVEWAPPEAVAPFRSRRVTRNEGEARVPSRRSVR